MTTEYIKQLIETNRTDIFYNSRTWRNKAAAIKAIQNNECQYCKLKGKVASADIIHHVKHLRRYPELALKDFYIDEAGQKQRQLIACCFDCHEKIHGRRGKKHKKQYTNKEQW